MLNLHPVVCPTCHSTDLRYTFWPPNVGRLMFDLLCVIVFWTPLLKQQRECLRCGARFYPARPREHRACWNCGYNLTGLPEPRCPECGTRFDRRRQTGSRFC